MPEVVGLSGFLQIENQISKWVSDDQIFDLLKNFELEVAGDVLIAIYDANKTRYFDLIKQHRLLIEERLANQYQILGIERKEKDNGEVESRIKIHFIPISYRID